MKPIAILFLLFLFTVSLSTCTGGDSSSTAGRTFYPPTYKGDSGTAPAKEETSLSPTLPANPETDSTNPADGPGWGPFV